MTDYLADDYSGIAKRLRELKQEAEPESKAEPIFICDDEAVRPVDNSPAQRVARWNTKLRCWEWVSQGYPLTDCQNWRTV